MYNLSQEEFDELTQYASKMGRVSVPQVQRNFGWIYPKARRGIDRLVELNKLEYKEGNVFEFIKGKDGNPSERKDSDISEDMEREIDEYLATYGDRKLDENVKFVMSIEERVIKSNIGAMEKHNKNADKATADKPVPKNAKLPQKYFHIRDCVKSLVNVAIECSSTKDIAHFGLCESAMRWKWGTPADDAYTNAIVFMDNLTENEFKIIKNHLVNR